MNTDRSLHIAWLVWGDEPGGVATAILNNGKLLQSLGQQVSLLSLAPGSLVDSARSRGWAVTVLAEDVTLHPRYLGHGFSFVGLPRRLAMLICLRRMLQSGLQPQRHPDVICLPWPDLMLLAGPVARRAGIGLVLEMPNTPSRYPLEINLRLYALAVRRWRVRMLANSAYSASRMARIPGVEVMTPAVDAARFDPTRVVAVSRNSLGVPADAILLGIVARLHPSKGADLVVAALARLGTEAANVHLLLVGGPLTSVFAQNLRGQIDTHGLSSRVHFVDTVADPECYLAACDLALNARRDVEPFGLSIVEAMLMGRPVIALAWGQPADTIVDGLTGWLYWEPDAAKLAQVLRRALEMRADWPAMGLHARSNALQRFASPEAGPRYLRLLRTQADAAKARVT